MLRSGMADFILNTPGNVKMRDVTAEENMKVITELQIILIT